MLTSVVVGWGLCFNQKTEYEMRISDWSSDVCSSDLSVGRDTFIGSLDSLKRRGLMVCVGTASGTIPPFDPQILAMKGSLYMTRPALADFITDPVEKSALAAEVFGLVASGQIKIEINQRYALQDAEQAHRDLEGRNTTGSSIFVI